MVKAKLIFMSDKVPDTMFISSKDAWGAEFNKIAADNSLDADYVGSFYAAIQHFDTVRSQYLSEIDVAKKTHTKSIDSIRAHYSPYIKQAIKSIKEFLQDDDTSENPSACSNCEDVLCRFNPKYNSKQESKVTPKRVNKSAKGMQ